MATIALSCCGEGRGHAARLAALTDELSRAGHRVLIFAPGDAYGLLSPMYEKSPVRVRRISGMRFAYDSRERLRLGISILRNIPYLVALPAMVRRLAWRLQLASVDLVISDFEPSLPRAARLARIPFVTVDHQSFLYRCNLGRLPAPLRWRAALMAPFTQAHYPAGARAAIVSGFFQPPLLPSSVPIKTAGVLLRPEVRDQRPTPGDHVVAYFRRSAPAGLLEALESCGHPVRVYGLGTLPNRGNLQFRPVSNRDFLADLASCHALVSTAGNQLVGEALWLGKPVLAIPEHGNWEQRFNAWFLDQGGQGMTPGPHELPGDAVARFLAAVPSLRQRILASQPAQDGMAVVLNLITSVVESLPPRAPRTLGQTRSRLSTPSTALAQ